MKSTIANILRCLLLSSIVLSILTISVSATPIVRKAASLQAFGILNALLSFTGDVGGTDNGVGGSRPTGYRNIDWDAVGLGFNPSGYLPPDYFNSTSPRGMVLSSACTGDNFRVSASGAFDIPLRFGEINATYPSSFKPLTGTRLFSADTGDCNSIDVYFYIPGTKIPATVNAFAVVFTDVDFFTSGITCYGVDGKPIDGFQTAPPSNNGLSFLGVTYNDGKRISHVRITAGSEKKFGAKDFSVGGAADVVVMDDFYYGEPKAIGHHTSDFDGDGVSDYSIFRPSNGTWYVTNSGSNTLSTSQFGQAGDIPVDGDFDGDSRNDMAVFRPSNGMWYVLRSSKGQVQVTTLGQAGDKPVSGDYDKDGITDIAVWRPSNGNYYVLKSSNGKLITTKFGLNGDIPIAAGNQ